MININNKMNPYMYNPYLTYSGGFYPQNYYYPSQQMPPQNYYYPPQFIPHQNQENFVIDVKQPEHQLQTTSNANRNCKLNMECKDVNCVFFHHPSLKK